MAQGLQLGSEELRRLWIAGGNLQMRKGGTARAEVLKEEDDDLI
jgi:hypothetical protein